MLQQDGEKLLVSHPEARQGGTWLDGFRRVSLEERPERMAEALAPLGGLVFLDSSSTPRGAISIVTAAPVAVLRGSVARDWPLVRETLARYRSAASSDWSLPAGGLFGWVGFDGCFTFGVYPHALAFAHDTGEWFESGDLSSRLLTSVEKDDDQKSHGAFWDHPLDFKPGVTRDEFIAAVKRAQDYIAAGDIYQVNLSFPWRAKWPASANPLAFYDRLRTASPAPASAFLDLDGTRVFSSSPECFLKMSGRDISTRPIKGTRPRFLDDPDRDTASAAELLASEKERAELLMITDLERNDLGQVCEFGSVTVPDLWHVEKYAQVFHLVSTVNGRLRESVDHTAAFRACFPGGSISGAPKKRALEIIAELEQHPRGLYTGAIGYFGFNGESQFNIAIRTALQTGDEITFHTGSGIVADSIPEREYEETLHKAAGILQAAGIKRIWLT
jgi:para-aminobenzoate synthetase component I